MFNGKSLEIYWLLIFNLFKGNIVHGDQLTPWSIIPEIGAHARHDAQRQIICLLIDSKPKYMSV